jgi:hypothetical protein
MNEIIIQVKSREETDVVKGFLNSMDIHFQEMQSSQSGFDWFENTERLNSILNKLIAHFNVELMNMANKVQTPEYKAYCTDMLVEVRMLNRNTEIWQNLSLMKFYIAEYSPLIRNINKVA